MREKSIPLIAEPSESSLATVTARNARIAPDHVAFGRRRPGSDVWQDVTCREFDQEVRALASGLRAAGIAPGDRVAIMSRTRYEWTLADFAIWAAGAVSVPIYETSSPDQMRWIADDSAARAVIVEQEHHCSVVAEVRDQLPDLQHVWCIEAGDLEKVADVDVDDAGLDALHAGMSRDDLATIIYTSGTTGRPKGCEITHGNFLYLTSNIDEILPEITRSPGASLLLFLPLAHVLARLIQVLAVETRMQIGHAPDVTALLPDLASFRPTFFLAVPRVFEKVYNSMDAKAAAEGKGHIFRLATRTAIAYSRSLDVGGPSLGVKLQHKLFDILVYGKLRTALGGNLAYAVSGGAPLGARLGHFYRGTGLVILEGYGLTETTAPTNVNTPATNTIGTVGLPLPGTSTQIADDGELLVKGVGIFRGYHNNPEATAEIFTEDGYLRTGDLGTLDDAGRLTITGRKKEIIVTASGKNVAPAPLEDSIRAHPLVSQCIVVGDQRPFVAALLTLDAEMLPLWAKAHNRAGLTVEEARGDDFVREHLQMAIDRANQGVSRAEQIRKFTILDGDFTEESGHLTPSMKVKRNVVMHDCTAQIDELYGATLDSAGPQE
ncbi:MAG: AMP-dependent synthetase/ligase [Dermatophilaceae bacterium]